MNISKECKIEKTTSDPSYGRRVLEHSFLDLSDKAKPVIVSTDGRGMAIVPVTVDATDTQGYVTEDALKAARKTKRGDAHIELNGTQNVQGISFPRPTEEDIGGKFPNWRQVVPAKDAVPVFEIRLNPSLLKDISDAIGSNNDVLLKFHGDGLAIQVIGQRGDGVLMPMKK